MQVDMVEMPFPCSWAKCNGIVCFKSLMLIYIRLCKPALLQVDMVEMLYRKSLLITSAVRSEMGVGAIVNLQSNDASKIWNMPLFLHVVWNGPFQARR